MPPSQAIISFTLREFPYGGKPPNKNCALICSQIFWLILPISYSFFSGINFACNQIVLHVFQKDFEFFIFRQSCVSSCL